MEKKIGIFFGSTTGTTENLAKQIAEKLEISSEHVHDIANTSPNIVNEYGILLLGSSTWGDGELQDDWYDFLPKLKTEDLTGKQIALFGCGDANSYPDTFCDAMAIIYKELSASGCKFIGAYTPDDYSITDSNINIAGKFIGLAIDDVNESNLTDQRITKWIEILKKEEV
ncbi:MAG: flavodoxin [Bacteroidales bacterium]|nr:flavodoxin [Bacteroidales bacterium]